MTDNIESIDRWVRGRPSRDRAVGALVGLAAGDAVGTTLEFAAPGTFEPVTDMVGGGPFGLSPGQWTDDTSMAMCLAESILDRDDLDPADQLRRYVAWRRDGYWSSTGSCFDIGTTTSRALARFERDGSVTDDPVDQGRAANGSLMRLAPVPIRWHRDSALAVEGSAASSRTTHPADRPVDACRLYGALTAAVIDGADFDEVLEPGWWRFGDLHPEVDAVRGGTWRNPDVRGSGYVVDALRAAVWAVAGAADFGDAVLRAANLGDDADTTAAIAGQLAGARWGWSSIPAEWRSRLSEVERIAAIAGRLHDRAVGAPSDPVWPHDDLIHGYWVDPGRVLAGEYPSALDDPVRARRKVEILVDHGIRTFVDLTGPDDRLEPYGRLLDEVARARGLDLRRINHPIPDMGTVDDAGYDRVVSAIEDAAGRGGVFVHCWGGIGRTGTVVGCLLGSRGMAGVDALARIAELRSGTRKRGVEAPQTAAQRAVVMERAARA